jgi:hypothetical protein
MDRLVSSLGITGLSKSQVSRCGLAAVPHALCLQPHGGHAEVVVGWDKALLHSVYDKPDAAAVHVQFDASSTPSPASCPLWPTTAKVLERTYSRSWWVE